MGRGAHTDTVQTEQILYGKTPRRLAPFVNITLSDLNADADAYRLATTRPVKDLFKNPDSARGLGMKADILCQIFEDDLRQAFAATDEDLLDRLTARTLELEQPEQIADQTGTSWDVPANKLLIFIEDSQQPGAMVWVPDLYVSVVRTDKHALIICDRKLRTWIEALNLVGQKIGLSHDPFDPIS